MTNLQIQKMKDTGSLELTGWQLFVHYSSVYVLIIISIITTITTTYFPNDPLIDKYNISKPSLSVELFLYRYIWLILALPLYYIQTKRLKFKVINISVGQDRFTDAAERTAKELNWKLITITSDMIIAKSAFSGGSLGELITIIRDNERVLINSICDPGKWMSVASYGKNKNNRDTYEQILREGT